MFPKAVITTPEHDLALYMEAHDSRDQVEGFLEYAKLQRADPLTDKVGDGWSTLSQVISNYGRFAGDVKFALAPYSRDVKLTVDGGGVYVVDSDWKIAGRECPEGHYPLCDHGIWTVYEVMSRANKSFPSVQQVDDERLREASRAFYSEMSDEEILERRRLRKAAAFDLQNHFWRDFADKQDAMAKFDQCPGIAEKLEAMRFIDRDERPIPSTKVMELYTRLYPADDMGYEIGENLTVEDVARWLDMDEPYLDDVIYEEPRIAERVLDFVADAYGIPYEDIYDRWDWGKECPKLRDVLGHDEAVRNLRNAISGLGANDTEMGLGFGE